MGTSDTLHKVLIWF